MKEAGAREGAYQICFYLISEISTVLQSVISRIGLEWDTGRIQISDEIGGS